MLSLLPLLEPEDFADDCTREEGSPLLRELKTEICGVALLRDEARPLLREARELEQLVEAGRLEEADACLRKVLRFPALASRSRLRNRIVFLVLMLLIWYLIRALVE